MDNLKGLNGVERITSVSSENSGNITVEIEEELDINSATWEKCGRQSTNHLSMEPLVVYKQEPRSTINFALTAKIKLSLNLNKLGVKLRMSLELYQEFLKSVSLDIQMKKLKLQLIEQLMTYFNDVAQAVAKSNIIVTGGG